MRENDEEAYEEVVTVSKVSSKVKLETAFAHTTEEATVTPKFLSIEEQGTMTNPKYLSREESGVATSTRKEGRPR